MDIRKFFTPQNERPAKRVRLEENNLPQDISANIDTLPKAQTNDFMQNNRPHQEVCPRSRML